VITTTGAVPTIEPETAEELAAALRRASEARQSIVIRGAGTKIDWGRPAQHVDAIVSTRALNRVLTHQHGDLTATIEAGATLRDVNETLARHGQWLPLDPPFADRATIGGLLATNDSGPLRHRFGTPRDLVIGVRLATTDGVLAKAGGQVVKNVAGYDLSKLVCGSFGSLAAIVSATFKLAPRPAASKTVIVQAPDVETLAQIIREVMSSQLEPIAFEVRVSSSDRSAEASRSFMSVDGDARTMEREALAERQMEREALAERQMEREALAERQMEREALAERQTEREALAERQMEREALAERQMEREALAERQTEREALAERQMEREALAERSVMLRFASVPAAVDAQIDRLRAVDGGRATRVIDGDEERGAWDEHSRRLWDATGAIVRASWLPATIASVVGEAHAMGDVDLIGRAAVGSGLIRFGGDARAQASAIEALRRSTTFRNVVIVRGSDELKSLVDVWGPQGDSENLFASLKHALDPHETLNARRGPL